MFGSLFLCETVTGLTVRVMVSGVGSDGPGGRKQNVTAAEDLPFGRVADCRIRSGQESRRRAGTFRMTIFKSERGKIQFVCGGGIFYSGIRKHA